MSEETRRPSRGPLIPISRGALFALAALALARALGIIALATALAEGIGGSDPDRFSFVLTLGILGAALRALSAWATPALSARLAADVAAREREKLLVARLKFPHRGGDASDVSLATRGMRDITPYVSTFIPSLVAAAVVPPVLFARVAWLDWPSAVTLAITLPLVPIFMALIGSYTADKTKKAAEAIRVLTDNVIELARGLAVLVSLGRERQQRRGLERVGKSYNRAVMQSLKIAFLSSLALEFIATMSVAVVAVVIGLRLLGSDIGLVAGLAVLIIAPECFAPLREMGQAYHAADDGRLALERLKRVVSFSGKVRENDDLPGEAFLAKGEILRQGTPVTQPLDIKISTSPGLTALRGESGSGKSSLIHLWAASREGNLSQSQGLEAQDCAPSITGMCQAPSLVAMVQEAVFTENTPQEELLAFARPEKRKEIPELLAAVGLEGQADAPLSEMSPGEQRRVAIARTLSATAAAESLLIDEPTAHLDQASAERIRELLRRQAGGQRVIVVTHDQLLTEQADEVYEIRPASGSSAAVNFISEAESFPVSPLPAVPRASSRPPEPSQQLHGSAQPNRLLELGPSVWLGVLLGAISAISAVALTALSGWLIVRASQTPSIMYLSVAIVGVRAFGLFRATARYGERLCTHEGMLRSGHRLRLRLWDALAFSPSRWRSISSQDGGVALLVSRVDSLRDAASRILVPISSATVLFLACTLTFALLVPGLLWVFLSLLLLCLGISIPLTLWAERAGTRAMAEHDGWLSWRMGRLYRAATDIAYTSRAEWFTESFRLQDERFGRHLRRAETARGLGIMVVVFIQSVGALIILFLTVAPASLTGQSAGLPLQIAAALILMNYALVDSLIGVLEALPHVRTYRRQKEKIAEVLDEQVQERPRNTPLASGEKPVVEHASENIEAEIRAIAAREVSVTYPSGVRIPPVDAEASVSHWLVLSGPSGCGKSTLLDVLAGFIAPTTGRVEALRSHGAGSSERWSQIRDFSRIAWCPQDAYLFDAPVMTNVLLGWNPSGEESEKGAPEKVARGALDAVGLRDLPLDRATGAGGSQLSGGQKQRVALARALVTGAEVFLLDEPTAHLDQPTAERLVKDLRKILAGRTVVIVSHEDLDVPARVLRLQAPTLAQASSSALSYREETPV